MFYMKDLNLKEKRGLFFFLEIFSVTFITMYAYGAGFFSFKTLSFVVLFFEFLGIGLVCANKVIGKK